MNSLQVSNINVDSLAKVSVQTFNILARDYTKDDFDLGNDGETIEQTRSRYSEVTKQILQTSPDVVCLQEVEDEFFGEINPSSRFLLKHYRVLRYDHKDIAPHPATCILVKKAGSPFAPLLENDDVDEDNADGQAGSGEFDCFIRGYLNDGGWYSTLQAHALVFDQSETGEQTSMERQGMWVVGVHLTFISSPDDMGEQKWAERGWILDQFEKHLQTMPAHMRNWPLVVAGDLNTDLHKLADLPSGLLARLERVPNEAATCWAPLTHMELGWQSPCARRSEETGGYHTCIDHIFFDARSISVLRFDTAKPPMSPHGQGGDSDHVWVMAELSINRYTSPGGKILSFGGEI